MKCEIRCTLQQNQLRQETYHCNHERPLCFTSNKMTIIGQNWTKDKKLLALAIFMCDICLTKIIESVWVCVWGGVYVCTMYGN